MKSRTNKGGSKPNEEDAFDRSTPETLANQVDAWLTYLRERSYSERTIKTHYWNITLFLNWTHERALSYPTQITKPILESYQRWLFRYKTSQDKPLSVRSQRGRLLVIKNFFSHLCKRNFLEANPASDLDLPKTPSRKLPRGLSKEDLLKLLNVPDISDPLGIRDRAILEVLYATAIRRTELVKLQLQDIDRSAKTLLVQSGKGGKSRLVPIGEVALYWVQRYFDESRPLLLANTSEQSLFLTGYGEAFHPDSLSSLVKKMMREAEIQRNGSTHLLRHTCATHMLEGGADIRLIQQLLGHAQLDTTSIYTQVAITHLSEVYKASHPSSQHPPNHQPPTQ